VPGVCLRLSQSCPVQSVPTSLQRCDVSVLTTAGREGRLGPRGEGGARRGANHPYLGRGVAAAVQRGPVRAVWRASPTESDGTAGLTAEGWVWCWDRHWRGGEGISATRRATGLRFWQWVSMVLVEVCRVIPRSEGENGGTYIG
jgi:hypothetical protein